jgi:DNA invertase Pin-like site-specific DNA recombinase
LLADFFEPLEALMKTVKKTATVGHSGAHSSSSSSAGGSGKRIGYLRVSSVDQNEARQLDGIQLDKLFTDKASGKDINRPQLAAMLEFVREGDHIFVHSMDRLSRSLRDLQEVVEKLTAKGITISFKKENLTFEPPAADGDAHRMAYSMFMLQLLGSVAQFERALIRERQREGIAIAKKEKRYKGRKQALSKSDVARLKELALDGVSKVDLAEKFNISRASVYVYLSSK